MALQILAPKQDYTAGQGALHGLASNLRSMASERLQQIKTQNEQRQLTQTLQSLGYNPSQASLISQLPVNQRLEALQGLAPAGQTQPQQQILQVQPEEQTAFSRAVRQQAPEQQEQPKAPSAFDLGQEANRIQAGLPETEQPLSDKEALQAFSAIAQKPPTPQQQKQIEERVNDLNANPEKMAALQEQYKQAVANNEQIEIRRPNYKGPAVPYQEAEPLFKKPLTQADKIAQQRLELARQKEERALRSEQRESEVEASKESKAFVERVRSEHEAARDNRKRLERMEELIDHGSLGSPLRNQAINWFKNPLGPHGPTFDVTSWMTADAQEMDKLSTDFAKGAKDFFPGRVTDADLKTFMRTVPSLMQSKAGMQRLINSMKSVTDAQDIRYNATRQIIRENGGKRPGDLEDRVEDRIGDRLDKLAQNFVKAPLIPDVGFGAGLTKY